MLIKSAIQIILTIFPWSIRRFALKKIFGYQIHPSARIGYSIVLAQNVTMQEHSRIGSLTICRGLTRLDLGRYARIGKLNWITGQPPSSVHFVDQPDRASALSIGEHSAITHRHLIDCTDTVTIGKFTTVAGWRSQILTHSIDLRANRQHAAKVHIGDYCFVGTASTVLKGTSLPSYSVLSAGSVLTKSVSEEWSIYAGNPAQKVKALEPSFAYFTRETGYVR